MRPNLLLLGGLLVLGGCGLVADQFAGTGSSDCEPWRAGCPILIDFRGDAPNHGAIASGSQPAGADIGRTAGAPMQIAPDSLSVPASEQATTVLTTPPALPPGTPSSVDAASTGTAAPAPPVRTTYPSFNRALPRVWVPGQSTTGGYGSSGRLR